VNRYFPPVNRPGPLSSIVRGHTRYKCW